MTIFKVFDKYLLDIKSVPDYHKFLVQEELNSKHISNYKSINKYKPFDFESEKKSLMDSFGESVNCFTYKKGFTYMYVENKKEVLLIREKDIFLFDFKDNISNLDYLIPKLNYFFSMLLKR